MSPHTAFLIKVTDTIGMAMAPTVLPLDQKRNKRTKTDEAML